MNHPWASWSDQLIPTNISGPPVVYAMNGEDTVGKTELSRAIERFFWADYYKWKEPLWSALDWAPPPAIVWLFMGSILEYVHRHRQKTQDTVLDPFDPIQIIARLKAEWKWDSLSAPDMQWIERQSRELMLFLLSEWYNVVSIHLTAEPDVTEKRLGGRINDSVKSSSYDYFLHAYPEARKIWRDEIARQVFELSQDASLRLGNRSALFVRYDTSNAPEYPTEFDTEELHLFLQYLREYFGINTIPSIVWTPYRWESEVVKWSNDHTHQEIILTTASLWVHAEKRTNWSIPVFMKDGEWYAGFGVDIFDFSRSSGELRLKPWWGQVEWWSLSERVNQKFRENSASIINANTGHLLTPDKKIIVPVWYSGQNKELTSHVTHLTPEQFADIRSTPRYCQILSLPIREILQTVHKKEWLVEPYITYSGREYRLAAWTLDMLLLFAEQKNIVSFQ